MTEKLPELPPAYQPPASVPPAPWEPPLVETGPPPSKHRIAALVITLGLVLVVGVVVLAVRVWPQGANGSAATTTVVTTTSTAVESTTTSTTSTSTGTTTGLPELQALPASAEAGLKDATDGTSTSIRFANTTGDPISVSWLNYDHTRTWYADLAPGQSYDQQTYTGHVWVITRSGGPTLALYVATATPAQATIRR